MAASHPWGHDALAADLARKLRNDGKSWTWLNATIGAWSGPRPDIMAFPRYRYDTPQIHAYEIKVSRSDLLTDLNSEKWRKYQEHCQTVTFAMPHGFATKEDIPVECGVMFRTARGWRTERRATNVGSACSIQAMAKLLTCHPAREPFEGLNQYRKTDIERQAENSFRRECGEKYGHALARAVTDIANGKDPAGQARDRADKIIADAKAEAEMLTKAFAPMFEMLGLKPDTSSWSIGSKIREAVADLNADQRVKRVESALERALMVLTDAQSKVTA